MTVLVTGASGCLGSHLVERLQVEGETVRVLIRKHSRVEALRTTGAEVVVGDVREDESVRQAVAGVAVVYHCAAYVSEKGDWTEFDESNIRGTERLLAAVGPATRFIHVSSIGVYGPAQNEEQRVKEEDGYDPYPWRRGFYTWSKIEADRLALRFSRRDTAGGVVVVRPGILYGPRAKPFVARAQMSWRGKFRLIVGTPDLLLPLTHVHSVVTALLSVGRGRGKSGEAYNVVDRPVTQAAYLRWLANEQANGQVQQERVVYLPLSYAAVAATVLETFAATVGRGRPRFPRYRLLRAYHGPVYDTSKAERELDWQSAPGPAKEQFSL